VTLAPPAPLRYTFSPEKIMATLAKTVSIADFVAELRKFPDAAFDRTEQIWKFLQDTPVASDSLAPYLIWDAQP
jgi:hypothetical protein